MPAQGASEAPKFDVNDHRTLKSFWRNFEYLCKQCGITDDKEMKEHATRLAPISEVDEWEELPEFSEATKTFADFKKAVTKLYPGANEESMYDLQDLDQLVGARARLGMRSLLEYNEFERKFNHIAKYLEKHNKLTPREKKLSFARGFPPELWEKIEKRLAIKQPDVKPGEAYEIEHVDEAAKFVLHGTKGYTAQSVTASQSSTEKVKTEPSLAEALQLFAKALSANQNPASSNSTSAPSRPNTSFSASRASAHEAGPTGCRFCGLDDHYIKACLVAEDYIKTGRASRNFKGDLVLPNGRYVPGHIQGKNLQERFDKWLEQNKQNSGSPPATQSGMLLSPMYNTTTASTQVEVREEVPEHPYARGSYAPPPPRVAASNPPKSWPRKVDYAPRSLPPVVDAQDVQRVFERSLTSNISISQKELLSISPDLRAKYREVVSGRRATPSGSPGANTNHPEPALAFSEPEVLPSGGIRLADPYEVYLEELPAGAMPRPLAVAEPTADIRELTAVLENKGEVNCILDPGCSIIAMSEGVAHAFQIGYDPESRIPLQSANGKVDYSLGLARNVAFKVNSLTLYVQAHVIRSPAYDVLFGRPFDVLGETCVRNYRDSSQTVTIRDPNSSAVITIPTKPRTEPRFPCPDMHSFRDSA
ncbi:hypothetical protein PENSPDRAFT_595385 [Peniophora sp. CONT]|nr:hypothetical protein PENSPDRAFT_595385 [Peniophora sp. CONT]